MFILINIQLQSIDIIQVGKMQKSVSWIILGLIFTAVSFFDQFNTVMLTAGLIFLISGLFMYRKIENKNLYVGLTSLVLISMSILTYLQFSNPSYGGSVLFNGIFFVLIVLVGIYVIYRFPQNWKL
jgi:hypothetical protein